MSERRLVKRGERMDRWPGGGLTVTTWGPEQTDLEVLRESYLFPDAARDMDDESLQAVIDGAKQQIRGRRLSWTVLACNYLRDGSYF